MFGCPNRCRHCWLGQASGRRMTVEDSRWVVEQFRNFRRPGERDRFWRNLQVQTWVREPDYSSEYRRLYELEKELSDLPVLRGEDELLSVWRLARDREYAPWSYSVGMRVCQLSFFGLEEVTDWACRRRGAFRDLLAATERLLEAGIRPRWQWFFTKRILPDLPGLIELTKELRLRERCEALGGPFTLFLHCPSADGEAWHLEYLRPMSRDLDQVPAWLREQSERHLGGTMEMPEGELVPKLLEQQEPSAKSIADEVPKGLWFHVTPDFDVYPFFSEMTPAWLLGNLKRDGVGAIVQVLENDRTPGLQAMFQVPVSELARRFGRRRGRRIYDPADLKTRWARMWAEAELES